MTYIFASALTPDALGGPLPKYVVYLQGTRIGKSTSSTKVPQFGKYRFS